jgi:hypothetical protein
MARSNSAKAPSICIIMRFEAIATVARQIDARVEPFEAIDMGDRTLKRQRAEIRALLGFREATVADGEALTEWIRDHAVADSRDIAELTSVLEQRCRDLKIEPPGASGQQECGCQALRRQQPSISGLSRQDRARHQEGLASRRL